MSEETISVDDHGVFGRALWLNVAAAAVGLTISAYQKLKLVKSLPPGPWGVPFLGYAPFLNNHCTYLTYNELARKYGPICSLSQRGDTVILLSDHKLIKTAFDMKQITGRPNDGYMDIIGGYGEFSPRETACRRCAAPCRARYVFSFSDARRYNTFLNTSRGRFLRGRRNKNILYKSTR